MNTHKKKPKVIELFCGCGGFSLGFEYSGFDIVAALDLDPVAVSTFKNNHPKMPDESVINVDIRLFPPEELAKTIGATEVDVIIGGPPCQGFSSVRQVDGSNSGKRMVHDPRRELYKEYFRYLEYFRPMFFVMENVLGMKTMNQGKWWTIIRNEARELGYKLCPMEILASDYGVPQNRRRLLIVGTREDSNVQFNKRHLDITHKSNTITLWEAIGDLPELSAGEGNNTSEYDMQLRKKHIKQYGKRYLFDVLQINKCKILKNHVARPHNTRDLRDFDRLLEGENSYQAIQRGVSFEFPYSKDIFKDRYTKLRRDMPCKTILAHLAKDGLMFIHPTQCRSITVREAARIQSFPDWFEFPDARTHAYRLIGNAVPPLVGKAIGKALMSLLQSRHQTIRTNKNNLLPKNMVQAERTLLRTLEKVDKEGLESLDNNHFLCAWNACFFIIPALHPDEALDHGKEVRQNNNGYSKKLHKRLGQYYYRSGWPVDLAPLAKEAWKRFEDGCITEEQFYCYDAVKKGIEFRK